MAGEAGGSSGTPGVPPSIPSLLSSAWFQLRLACRAPQRRRPWDAILLTAASPDQAALYSSQLEAAKKRRHVAESTVVLAVPDADGKRIGSGGATLGALKALHQHLLAKDPSAVPDLSSLLVLMVHAGGDSKRVPWANPIGKPFIPFPLLAGDDPEGPPLTLFDHILAVSALAQSAFSNRSGLLIMTGDVLPCFDASSIPLPAHGAVVVTAPAPLDVASRHGVIVPEQGNSAVPEGDGSAARMPEVVADLLQKPRVPEMVERGAVYGSGQALLDTGIFAVVGDTWRDLIGLASQEPDPLVELLASGKELCLYSEVAGAWVRARHDWLRSRPLGPRLVLASGSHQLYHYRADDLTFLHFGTTGEILDHLRLPYEGRLARRHLSTVAAGTECDVAPSAVLVHSEVRPGASVGPTSLVCSSMLVPSTKIGARCVVLSLDMTETASALEANATEAHNGGQTWRAGAASKKNRKTEHLSDTLTPIDQKGFFQGYHWGPLIVPSHRCVWQVPLKGGHEVTLCCGVDDNPKDTEELGGTFCGVPWGTWLAERGIEEHLVWPEDVVRGAEPGSAGQAAGEEQPESSGAPQAKGTQGQEVLEKPLLGAEAPVSAEAAAGAEAEERRTGASGSVKGATVIDSQGSVAHSLWHATLFPIVPKGWGLPLAMWLMGVCPPGTFELQMADTWRHCERLSLAALHEQIDFDALRTRDFAVASKIMTGLATSAIESGSLLRNFHSLAQQLAAGGDTGLKLCRMLAHFIPPPPPSSDTDLGAPSTLPVSFDPKTPRNSGTLLRGNSFRERVSGSDCEDWTGVPSSRVHQARVDLFRAAGMHDEAEAAEAQVWCAVAEETALAVCVGDTVHDLGLVMCKALPRVGTRVRVELPVRLDVAGGWSDTPPFSLERVGRVLNLAVLLEGKAPVGAEVEVIQGEGVFMEDDSGAEPHHLADPGSIPAQLAPSDPFCLVKAALLVTGLGGSNSILGAAPDLSEDLQKQATPLSILRKDLGQGGQSSSSSSSSTASGLKIKTWAAVPRGSGLGTSSILAAALVKALKTVLLKGRGEEREVSEEEVSHLVLVMEQRMGTGGGWQDQIGGLYPGIKCTTSLPTRPMKLLVEPIPVLPEVEVALRSHLILVFTGQNRLARNVLEKVVSRYLQRDDRLIHVVERLTDLALLGTKAITTLNFKLLGSVMAETWKLHQELDPFCSNSGVDELFEKVAHLSFGYKLVGAGGGGFGMLVARSESCGREIKKILTAVGEPVKIYDWSLAQT